MHVSLQPVVQVDTTRKIVLYGLGSVNIGLWCFVAYNEVKQLRNSPVWYKYFASFWNWADITGCLLNIFIIVCGMIQNEEPYVSNETLRIFAAIASFCILLKAFDWMRLFEGTAFYILLVEMTIKDIGAFMIVLLFSLIVFGMPMGFLNMNRYDDTSLVENVFGFWVVDTIFS